MTVRTTRRKAVFTEGQGDKAVDPPSEESASAALIYSLLLGTVFAGSWLGYTATVAEDGREAITVWLDPMLAGATLGGILLMQVALVMAWSRLSGSRARPWLTWGLILAEWSYILGEVLSNTITVGEPPEDIGSLFEIGAGVLVLLCSIGLSAAYARSADMARNPRSRAVLSVLAAILFAGLLWWFSHPVDQSRAGAPACVTANPLYNLFHGPCP
jgi:hypothetical protein